MPPRWQGFHGLEQAVRDVIAARDSWILAGVAGVTRLKREHFAKAKLDAALVADSGHRRADLENLPFPAINISNSAEVSDRFPRISMDEEAAGRRIADHFRSIGARSYFFLGLTRPAFSRLRGEGFRRGCIPFPVHLHNADSWFKEPGVDSDFWVDIHHWNWMMARALNDLERPIGIFAVDDGMAAILLQALQQTPWRVSEDIMVASVNDSPAAASYYPALSSLELPCRNIVEKALNAFDAWIDENRPIADQSYSVAPGNLAIRETSMPGRRMDEALERALAIIRKSYAEEITVDELARRAGVSRRKLEYHFNLYLGHGPYTEILRLRSEKAKLLLSRRQMSMSRIAESSGFGTAQRMGLYFRRTFGYSPRAYRKDAWTS